MSDTLPDYASLFGVALYVDAPARRLDELDDLLALLLDHRSVKDEPSAWLANAVASAALGEQHLWQDLGLPSRRELSLLMQTHFTSLARLNSADMKWKKFLYRQLCEREGLTICRSPSCGVCCDYTQCFGPEEAVIVQAPPDQPSQESTALTKFARAVGSSMGSASIANTRIVPNSAR